MKYADKTFLSSTFWSERAGPTAALKTLEIMEKTKSWKIITYKGIYLRKKWSQIAKKNNLKVVISGIPALSSFNFKSKNNTAYKTLIAQEMLKKGFLASNSVYLYITFKKNKTNIFYLEKSFKIKNCEKGKKIEDMLEGPVLKLVLKVKLILWLVLK